MKPHMTDAEQGSMVLLTRLARVVYRRATDEIIGMRLKQYMTLSNLRGPGALPQQELCATMHLDPNNCVLLLNDLEVAGHIRRVRNPSDRRRHIVEITSSGRRALAEAEQALNGVEDEVLATLSAEERETLRSLLARALEIDAPAPA
jgi:DNA-binding MarR family transcriptional regulator